VEHHVYRPDVAELMADGVAILMTLVIVLASLVLGIIIWWKIFSKAGYSGALGLLMLVPIANLVMLLVLAFGQWPIQRELEHLRQWHSGVQPPVPQPPAPTP